MIPFRLIVPALLPLLLMAQTPDSASSSFPDSMYTVGRIVITGNATTREYVIENEMTLRDGDIITHEAVEYSKDRIYSLRLFTKVMIDVLPDTGRTATLLVRVSERWYFYPYPVLGFKDRNFSKFYAGAGIIHNNVGGRNILMYGQFALGYDPFISFGYADPLFGFKRKIFFAAHVSYTEQRNKSLVSLQNGPNFDEVRWGSDVSLGKRYSLFSTTTVMLEYLNLRVSDNRSGRTLSSSGRDAFFSLSLAYRYDTRDFADYPRMGTFFSAAVSKVGLFDPVVDYQRYAADLRRFIPVGLGIVAAGRAFTSIAAGGRVPNYGHMFYGYNERIRGHFHRILEGEQIAGGTAEIHLPLIAPGYIHLKEVPVEQFRDFYYAVNAAFFADAGATWYRGEPFSIGRFLSGYGFGLHIILAYSAVGRIEYAVPYGRNVTDGEIILDIGAAL